MITVSETDSSVRRFFLDGRKLGDGGIGTFIKSFVEGLIESNKSLNTNFELELIISEEFDKKIGIPKLWSSIPALKISLDKTKKYSLAEYLIFPLKWKNQIASCDFYISPHYTLPYFIPIKKIVIIHDLIQLRFPETILHSIIPKWLITSALKRANNIATVSKASAKTIQEYFELPKGISIIPNSIRSSLLNAGKKAPINSKVVNALFVGSDRLHKQLDFFLEFIALAKKQKVKVKGIIVSNLRDQSIRKIDELGIKADLEIYDSLSDQELLNVYLKSDALVVTSADEGFCLPLLEAMFLGLNVVCPNLDFAKELTEDAGSYFESGSLSDLLRVWVDLNINSELRRKKLESGILRANSYRPLNQFQNFLIAID